MPASTIPHGDGWPKLWQGRIEPLPPDVALLAEILRDLPKFGSERACVGSDPRLWDALTESDCHPSPRDLLELPSETAMPCVGG
jgi:hypothetical protein